MSIDECTLRERRDDWFPKLPDLKCVDCGATTDGEIEIVDVGFICPECDKKAMAEE